MTTSIDLNMFQHRRQRLMSAFELGAIVVVPSAHHSIRNHDVEHEWRQASDFWYLTGFDEPDSVLVMRRGRTEGETLVFVRPRDPAQETWHGRRAGIERAAQRLGVDCALDVNNFEEEFAKLCDGASQVVAPLGQDTAFDQRLIRAARRHRTQPRLHMDGPNSFIDLAAVLSEQRLHKSPAEIENLRRAGAITAQAHHEAMRICQSGRNERELQAAVEYVFRAAGSDRVGYGSIVARGDNSTILHYRENCDEIGDGDLVLIDAGAEIGYLTADVTRTFPACGKFSDAQRQVYEIILDAEKQAISLCTIGHTILDVHNRALRVLTQGMIDLGLLSGNVEELVNSGAYKPYYMHRTSHWLGMDVHDTGRYHDCFATGNLSRSLVPSMVLTVEPGIYVPIDDEKAPAHLRGIGIRIEDDVLVTTGQPEVLTAACVKEIADVEAMVGTGGLWCQPVVID